MIGMGGELAYADSAGNGTELLERSQQLAALQASLARVIETTRGGTVLVPGEAGIGKTSLLRAFCAEIDHSVRVLWACCDPLFMPRPLGPLLELADDLSPELAAQITAGGQAFDVAGSLFRELRRSAPVVLVLEDVHWADEATLDVVRLIARRIDSIPVLLAMTYRDDESDRGSPLQVVLGELSGAARILARVGMRGLSRSAVATMSAPIGVDPDELHERTQGNPFYVTEVLASGTKRIPHSVRDAVLARAARVSHSARDLLDAAAVVPGHVDARLLDALDPAAMLSLDECISAGILTAADGRVSFRHEIARLVVEESLPAGRRTMLHRRVLSALEKDEDAPLDLARLAYHAEAAGDTAAVLRYAPAAAQLASAAGAHRDAFKLLGRALELAGQLGPADRADLLEQFAQECFFTSVGPQGKDAITEALRIRQSLGDLLGEGRTLVQLSRHLGGTGHYAEGLATVQKAVAVLEQIPPSAELALAYVHLSSAYAVALRPEALALGAKAIALGQETQCPEAIYSGLNNIGTIEIFNGDLAGVEKLERSREMAEQARDSFAVGRAYLHLCWMSSLRREWRLVERYIEPAIAYVGDHGHELWLDRLHTLRMETDLALGRWDQAVGAAAGVLSGSGPAMSLERCCALVVLAKVRARRGEDDYWPALDEARELAAEPTVAVQMPVIAAARAEAAWLERRIADALAEAEAGRSTGPRRDPLAEPEVDCWRWRAGAEIDSIADHPEPYRMLLTGDWAGARQWWQERGCRYEAALAAVGSGDVIALRAADEELRALAAWAAVGVVTAELRSLGERTTPREPRAATRGNPAGLTEREIEVLALVAIGMRNTQIAARLYLSPRTVDHHVSAVLRKLGANARSEAVAAAMRLGLIDESTAGAKELLTTGAEVLLAARAA
jgi:DNA-binding CsgD family transcriptional regulator/tetratricopeptide (TPR) repeat protein